MKLHFYVFITIVILEYEYGKGVDGLEGEVNGVNTTNNSKYVLIVVINPDEINKPISRMNYDFLTKKEKNRQMRVQKAHDIRMKEIIEFMKTHIYSTIYLLNEVQRIKRDHQIKDDLREMVTYLEKPDNYKEKQLVLNFFYNNKKNGMNKKIFNVWNRKPNDAVINILKDPFNDGVIN